jgi:outer membrane immunogenic protein
MQTMRARVIGSAMGLAALVAAVPATADGVNGPSYDARPYLPSIWQGLYGGLHLGYGKADPADGFVGGVQIGYNWQASRIVYGLEADASFADISAKESFMGATAKASIDWLASVRGRAGFLLTPNILAYGTLGVGYARASGSSSIPGVVSISVSDSDTAFVYGLGIEGKLSESMSVRVEYLSFGDLDISVVRAGLNFKFGN